MSGRYKGQLVEGSGNGYLRTAGDYVHLNPVRAKLLAPADRLLAYPWSSFALYLAAPEPRPRWLRAERLRLGKPKGARTNLHKFMNCSGAGGSQSRCDFQ